MKLKHLLCIGILAVLAACVSPQSPAQAVFQLEGNYAAALSVENNYNRLPSCKSPTKPLVCQDTEVAKTVRKVDDIAWAAISKAQSAVRTPGFGKDGITTAVAAATNAVGAFSNIVATLGVK